MRLVTGCNAGYLPRMMGYLACLRRYADFPVTFVGVRFTPPDVGKIETVTISAEQNAGAPPETECIQHGSFLSVMDCPDDEVIIYTDGDMVMQRPLEDDERTLLELGDNQVCTGYNFGAPSTLRNDGNILGPLIGWDELEARYGEIIHTAQDWNAGWLAMNRRTWKRLHTAYIRDYPAICGVFSHMARQQWLISWEIAALGFEVKIAPWSLHAHGHGGLKPGMQYGSQGLYHEGRLAAFRHHA